MTATTMKIRAKPSLSEQESRVLERQLQNIVGELAMTDLEIAFDSHASVFEILPLHEPDFSLRDFVSALVAQFESLQLDRHKNTPDVQAILVNRGQIRVKVIA